jgi:hypothetical protein
MKLAQATGVALSVVWLAACNPVTNRQDPNTSIASQSTTPLIATDDANVVGRIFLDIETRPAGCSLVSEVKVPGGHEHMEMHIDHAAGILFTDENRNGRSVQLKFSKDGLLAKSPGALPKDIEGNAPDVPGSLQKCDTDIALGNGRTDASGLISSSHASIVVTEKDRPANNTGSHQQGLVFACRSERYGTDSTGRSTGYVGQIRMDVQPVQKTIAPLIYIEAWQDGGEHTRINVSSKGAFVKENKGSISPETMEEVQSNSIRDLQTCTEIVAKSVMGRVMSEAPAPREFRTHGLPYRLTLGRYSYDG